MLELRFIRENTKLVKNNLKKRKDLGKLKWIDDLLKKDKEYRKSLIESQKLRHKRNIISQEINKLQKQGKDIKFKLKQVKEIPHKIKQIEEKQNELRKKIKFYLMRIPNILHKSVPYGKDDTENKVIRKYGKIKKFKFELKSHGKLIEDLNQADFKRAVKISGAGFYYLKDKIALLDLALQKFAIDFLLKKKFTLIIPPYMMNKKSYSGVTDLADFENVMYKIENEDLYIIATSEHPMVAMYMNETLDEDKLPIKFCGVSANFRREIGSRGVDTKGLFRTHQFNKVEQVVICKPKDSWKIFDQLQKNSEEMYKKLKIPFRIVNICTGDIGIVASKKYDIEAYFPREKKYREIGSCSNCTSYQAVRLKIRYKKKKEKEYVHTLNNTAIATSRTLRAIIENYQQKDGSIKVPTVLVKYMNGIKKIEKAPLQKKRRKRRR